MNVSREIFEMVLPVAATRETSADPGSWRGENPLSGHCAVVSLVAQDLYGGEILRGSLDGTPWANMRSHYWNALPDGEYDFTAAQFEGKRPEMVGDVRTREYLLSNESTRNRYELLRRNLSKELGRVGLSLD